MAPISLNFLRIHYRCLPDSPNPVLPKPITLNPGKVHSMQSLYLQLHLQSEL